MLKKFLAYLRTPTTIHGISAILGLGAAVAVQLLTKQTTDAGAAGALVYGLVMILMPDNSAEATSVEQFVKDGIAAAVAGHVQAALPTLVTDAVAVIKNAIVPTSATATLTTTTSATATSGTGAGNGEVQTLAGLATSVVQEVAGSAGLASAAQMVASPAPAMPLPMPVISFTQPPGGLMPANPLPPIQAASVAT